MKNVKLKDDICRLLRKNGAMTFKQIGDVYTDVISYHINEMISDKLIHSAYVLSENATEYYDNEEKKTKEPLPLMQALEIIAEAQCNGARFREFDKNDWGAWAGCKSENPRILENNGPDDGGLTAIVDGNNIQIYDADGDVIFMSDFVDRLEGEVMLTGLKNT